MAQLNISIPDELKERMDALQGERVIWSRIAASAFGLEVESRTLKGKDMESAIRRLHASRKQSLKEDRHSGIEAGKTWAITDAKWSELRDVAGIDQNEYWNSSYSAEGEGMGLWDLLESQGYKLHDLFETNRHGNPMTRDDLSDAHAEGFIEGANLVFDEVEKTPEQPEAA